MMKSRIFAWVGLTIGVGAAMAVALDDVAVGIALGAAIATVMTRKGRNADCGLAARARE